MKTEVNILSLYNSNSSSVFGLQTYLLLKLSNNKTKTTSFHLQQMETISDPSGRVNSVPDDENRVHVSVLEPHGDGAGRQRDGAHHTHAVLQLEALHAHWTRQVLHAPWGLWVPWVFCFGDVYVGFWLKGFGCYALSGKFNIRFSSYGLHNSFIITTSSCPRLSSRGWII